MKPLVSVQPRERLFLLNCLSQTRYILRFANFCTLILSLLLSFSGYSQTDAEIVKLNKLDSSAFAALESNAPDATKKANELLAASQKANSPVHQINAYTILGIINKNKGYYITSVDYYNNALKVAEKSKDDARISACYNNIGTVYQIQENYEKALVHFKKSLEIEEKLKNPLQKSIRLYNIGEIYREMDSLSLAISNFNSSLIIEKEHKNNEGIVYALLGLADVYLQLDRPTDASISLDDAKDLIEETDIELLILYYTLRGELHYRKGEFDESLSTLQKAKDISKENEFRVHLMDIYEKEIKVKTAQEKHDHTKKKDDSKETSPIYLSKTVWFLAFLIVLIFSIIIYMKQRASRKRMTTISENNSEQSSEKAPKFKLENDKGKIRIELIVDQILCFEANDNYVVIYHLDESNSVQKSMQRISLKKVEQILRELNVTFKRVHKSYLINPSHIEKVGGKAQAYRVRLKHFDKEVPVSRNFQISDITG